MHGRLQPRILTSWVLLADFVGDIPRMTIFCFDGVWVWVGVLSRWAAQPIALLLFGNPTEPVSGQYARIWPRL